jgi:hypothetical protein
MSSVIRETLTAYVAGRVTTDHVVAVVTTAYYRDAGRRSRKALRPMVDVIERASPGVVELAGRPEGAGFDVRPAERPFPEHCEPDLRRAIEAYLGRETAGAGGRVQSALARLAAIIKHLLSASA